MDDPDLVRETAAQFVADMGENAVGYLIRQAELAAEMGDIVSEQAWRDVAAAANLLIGRVHLP
jgi:hypothetical protein